MKKVKNLDQLIEEATIDCYDEHEQRIGFFCTLEDKLEFPFPAKVVGEKVMVTGVSQQNSSIEAICQKGNKTYRINILNIECNPKKVQGSQWIKAYQQWSK